jgi:pimeloyl-ACP methyl ester carboxylesterase
MSYLERFHYQITGNPEGNKLVFLHGLMGSGLNWRRIAQAFEDRWRILTFDQRGHGRSFHPENGYRPVDYAEDLLQILNDLGWDRVALVGHSMGGRNALEFADRHPHRLTALVIEDISPANNWSGVERIERLLNAVPTPFSSREAARDFFADEYPARISWSAQPEVMAKFLHNNIEPKADGTYDWRFARDAIFKSLREGRDEDKWQALRALTTPTLVMRGARSEDLTPEDFARMRVENPRLNYVQIEGAGHWIHFDQPGAFIEALGAFLLTCPPSSVY